MSARRAVWEVARREVVERSRSRVLQVSLLLLLLLSVGGAIAAARLSGQTPTDSVALAGARSVALEPAIRLQAQAAGRRVRLSRLPGDAAASHAVRNGTVAVALIDGNRIVVKTKTDVPAVRVLRDAAATQSVLDRLRASGLTREQAINTLRPAALSVVALEPNSHDTKSNQNLVFVSVVALFALLMLFGQAVAQGVTEEKSSRIVELLLTAVSPRCLLAGKVLGIGALGLGLLLIPGAAAVIAGSLAGGTGLPSAAPTAVALVVLWFILGYFFYSVAFAAVGALVSRQEDLSTAIVPIIVVMTGGFMLTAVVSNTNPDGTVAQLAAFVPPFSPMIVPARMVLGHMGALALVATVALDVLATVGLIMLAARIYERAIMRIGAPVKLRRLFATRSLRTHEPHVRAKGRHTMPSSDDNRPNIDNSKPRLSPFADLALRMVGVVLVLAGAVIGFGHAFAIVLVGVGMILIILDQSLKYWPRRPVH